MTRLMKRLRRRGRPYPTWRIAFYDAVGGCQVVEAEDPLSAARKGRGLADVGLPFVLVADRGMPTSDSTSFDGGLEAVKRLQQADLHPPVLLMTDRMNRGLHARARKLGVTRFVFKPGLSRLDPAQFEADLQAFAVRMLEAPIHYCASKAAVKGLTEALAKEVARYGIRVNSLAPGLLEDGVGRNLPEHRLADYLKHCALGRIGRLDEVARLAAFLVSDGNGYMSGETVVIDGGV